jgi:hypothetical protein
MSQDTIDTAADTADATPAEATVRPSVDLDAILAQRAEATGGEFDTVAFRFHEQTWTCKHPLLADDEWKRGLDDLEDNEDVAAYYLGAEQYERFCEAGGRAGFVILVLREIGRDLTDVAPNGRPTRRSTSSAKHRKR